MLKRNLWRLAIGALAFGLLPALAADDLDALMNALALAPHGRAGFIERHYLAVLDRPLESSGELLYAAPDHLEKRTLKPKPSSLIVVGEVLTVQRGSRKHVMQLRDLPQAAPFIDSIRATLAGDRVRLERHFQVQMRGTVQDWSLNLTPLAAKDSGVLQISLHGAGGELKSVDILQSDRDRSELLITPLPP
jgi:hypothetical protein